MKWIIITYTKRGNNESYIGVIDCNQFKIKQIGGYGDKKIHGFEATSSPYALEKIADSNHGERLMRDYGLNVVLIASTKVAIDAIEGMLQRQHQCQYKTEMVSWIQNIQAREDAKQLQEDEEMIRHQEQLASIQKSVGKLEVSGRRTEAQLVKKMQAVEGSLESFEQTTGVKFKKTEGCRKILETVTYRRLQDLEVQQQASTREVQSIQLEQQTAAKNLDGKLKEYKSETGKALQEVERKRQEGDKKLAGKVQEAKEKTSELEAKQQTSTREAQQELQRSRTTIEERLGRHKETIEQQQAVLKIKLSAPMAFLTDQREYRIRIIESAIAQRDIPRLGKLLSALPDLRGINLTEAVGQAVDKESFSTEQQIELRSKGAILSFRNLIEDIDSHLESIEVYPENQPTLKKLYHLLERYIKNWQEGTLQSAVISEDFDQAATEVLKKRYELNGLSETVTQVLNQELQKDKEASQKFWLLDQAPAAIKKQFDEKIEEHYLYRLRNWIIRDMPWYDQIQPNIQRAFYERYKENKLEESYAQEMDNTVAMEVLEKLTSQNPNIKPLTPEFGQALVAEATKVEATDEFKGKIYTDKTPIYKAAITNLLKKWRDESLEQETTPEVFAEFKGIIQSRLAAIRLENPLRESLEREGINILIEQVKAGYRAREETQTKEEPKSQAKSEASPEELSEELLDILLKDIDLAIGSIKPKPEEIRQSLRKLLTIKREDPERLTEEDHTHIDNITQERWNHYLTQLRPYAYPSLMQGQVQKLTAENQELKTQLAQMQTMVTQLSSQFAQFTGRQDTETTEQPADIIMQAQQRVGMFGRG
jgi:hypothetical protein